MFLLFFVEELEIQDKTILQLAVILSLVGVFALFLISRMYADDFALVGLIQGAEDGAVVSVQGTVQRITVKDNVVFLSLATETVVDATVFTDEQLSLSEGERVKIVGKVNTYKDKKSIVVDQLEKVGNGN